MKQFFFLIIFFPLNIYSQNCRYNDRVFPSFLKQSNTVYATAQGIPSVYLGESFTTSQNLTMDIFQPSNDIETKRALIIFAHSGGFINGSKDHQDMQALCDSFVRRGYVTASINYRLNFNLLSSSSAERAVWRGVQDASSAVRYFKSNAALYKVDTSKIFFWGSSAGSFMALNLAYLDDAERPETVYNPAFGPDLGCKDCSGLVTPNNSSVTGVISCWGAVGDTSWINNNNNIPCQMFHGTADATVPIDYGPPFGLGTLPSTYGSDLVDQRMNHVSMSHEYYPAPGQGHEYWGTSNGTFVSTGPTIYWKEILDKATHFMLDKMGILSSCTVIATRFLQVAAVMKDKAIAQITWKTAGPSEVGTRFRVEFSENGSSWITVKEIDVTASYQTKFEAFHSVPSGAGQIFYRIISIEPGGNAYYSNIVKLGNHLLNQTLVVYPNPVKDRVKISFNDYQKDENKIGIIYNNLGGRVKSFPVVSNETELNVSDLAPGIYLLRVSGNNNQVSSAKMVVE